MSSGVGGPSSGRARRSASRPPARPAARRGPVGVGSARPGAAGSRRALPGPAGVSPRRPRPRWLGQALRVALIVAAALALVLAVLLSASPAFAQEGATAFRAHFFTDASGSQAYYFDVMGAAGVIRGDSGPGGPCRPTQPATRAEFAVMVLRLLALDPAFRLPDGGSVQFRDAGRIPSWATSAVAACSALGIVTGAPDGLGGYNFNPADPVTGAEATAMLLRALGNDEGITGGWPAGYLFRAYETGLFAADVAPDDWRTIGPLVPLTRAQMAYLLESALFCSRGYRPAAPGGEGIFTRASIGGRLAGHSLVIDADLGARSLVTSDGQTLTLAEVVTCAGVTGEADLVGRRVFWLRDGRGRVSYILRYAAEPAITGDLARLELKTSGSGQTVSAIVLADGRTIPCTFGAIIELNGQRWPFDPGTVLPVAQVTAIMDGGKAAYVSIIQEDLPEAVVKALVLDAPAVAPGSAGPASGTASTGTAAAAAAQATGATTTTGRITARISMGAGDIPLLVTRDTRVFLNGRPADLSELREWDVFYAATEGGLPKTALRLYAYRTRVTGTVVNVVRVYDSSGFHWKVQVQDAGGKTVDLGFSDFCQDLVSVAMVGQEMTFCCNRLGQVTFFHTPAPAAGAARVVKALRGVVAGGRRLLTLDWQGSELTYALLPEVAMPVPGTLLRVVTDEQGTIVRTDAVRPAYFEATVVSYDPALARLTLNRDQRTWTLMVRSVPVYAVTDINDQAEPGPAVPYEALVSGRRVWLEDPGAPGYILVLTESSG